MTKLLCKPCAVDLAARGIREYDVDALESAIGGE